VGHMSSPESNPESEGPTSRSRGFTSRNGRRPAVERGVEPLLEVKIELHGGATVLYVSGDVDLLSEPVLRSAVSSQLDAGPEVLVLDLSGVSFLGSIGMTVLMAAREQAWLQGTGLRLVCSGHPVLRPMAITGLISLFEIYPDVGSAIVG
jgi:anti-sigma B factor antagonist